MTNITMIATLPFFSPLTKKQIEILEAEFSINSRPDITTRDRLAHTLKLSNLLIHVWFQNRRRRLRRSPPQMIVPTKNKFIIKDQPLDLSISTTTTEIRKSSSDVADRPIDLSLSNHATAKRKSPCDINDRERTALPCKEPATQPTAMTSSSYRSSRSRSGATQSEASRDTPSGDISSLMSVEFLSRSSRPAYAPARNVGPVYRPPMFYPPHVAFPYVTYYS